MEMLQNKLMKRSKVLSVILTVFWVLCAVIGLYLILMLLMTLRWGGDMTFAQRAAETGQAAPSPKIADMTMGQLRAILLSAIPGGGFGRGDLFYRGKDFPRYRKNWRTLFFENGRPFENNRLADCG